MNEKAWKIICFDGEVVEISQSEYEMLVRFSGSDKKLLHFNEFSINTSNIARVTKIRKPYTGLLSVVIDESPTPTPKQIERGKNILAGLRKGKKNSIVKSF